MKKILLPLGMFSVLLLFVIGTEARSALSKDDINYIVKQVADDELSQEYVRSVLSHKKIKKIPNIVRMNIINRENKNNYLQFSSSYAVKKAHRFARKWRTLLRKASKKFNVDKEVIISILFVETNFGKFTGNNHILSVFSSIILENNPVNRKEILRKVQKKHPDVSKKYVFRRLEKKAAWATQELKSLLELGRRKMVNPLRLKGSYAGAFGIPQFLPSSYVNWGYDYEKNGTINLFLIPDAVYSTANYLRSHGWKTSLSNKKKKSVIHTYNPSDNYVNAVFTLSQKLKQRIASRQQRLKAKQALSQKLSNTPAQEQFN